MGKIKLHWQVLIAMLIGCIFGLFLKNVDVIINYIALLLGKESNIIVSVDGLYQGIVLLGTIFIRLLKMVMVPLIFTSIILGVSSIGSGKKVGRIGLKTLLYYVSTSLLAIITGLFFGVLIIKWV